MADLLLRGWNGKLGDGCEDKTLWEEGFLLLVYHRVQSLRFAFLILPVAAGPAHDECITYDDRPAHDDRKGHHYYTTGGPSIVQFHMKGMLLVIMEFLILCYGNVTAGEGVV